MSSKYESIFSQPIPQWLLTDNYVKYLEAPVDVVPGDFVGMPKLTQEASLNEETPWSPTCSDPSCACHDKEAPDNAFVEVTNKSSAPVSKSSPYAGKEVILLVDPAETVRRQVLVDGATVMNMNVAGADAAKRVPRRTIATVDEFGLLHITDRVAPITPELVPILANHQVPIRWNNTWPHYETEKLSDDPAEVGKLVDILQGLCSYLPFSLDVRWAQRRWLRYTSDGDFASQRDHLGAVSFGNNPWLSNGNPDPTETVLDPENMGLMSLTCHKCGRPIVVGTCVNCRAVMKKLTGAFPELSGYVAPLKKQGLGNQVPLLYEGPAWLVYFTLEGMDLLSGNCRVFVKDDGTFISSDWCQRDARKSPTGGINLHLWQHTFPEWILNALIPQGLKQGLVLPQTKTTTANEIATKLASKQPATPVPSITKAVVELVAKGLSSEDVLKEITKRYENGMWQSLFGAPVSIFGVVGRIGKYSLGRPIAILPTGASQYADSHNLSLSHLKADIEKAREVLLIEPTGVAPYEVPSSEVQQELAQLLAAHTEQINPLEVPPKVEKPVKKLKLKSVPKKVGAKA